MEGSDKTSQSKRKKVLVSGCYDLLHAGHVAFFESAAKYGDLYVCIGTDKNVELLKGHLPLFSQEERICLIRSLSCVKEARLESGTGMLAFAPELEDIKPDILVVNDDGCNPEKQKLCAKFNVEYLVLKREPHRGLPARSSTSIKNDIKHKGTEKQEPPYRICLAGGWMDQPFVSKFGAGSVVVVNIHPTIKFNLRSGMATSTRNKWWGEIWDKNLFNNDPEELAKLLFGFENPPGSTYVSGSQDALGLCLPGINRLYYNGNYWPEKITRCVDPDICDWLERSLRLVEIADRPDGYDPLQQQNLTTEGVARLGKSGDDAWDAIMEKDIVKLGKAITATHRAWGELLPLTTTVEIERKCNTYADVSYGRITSGCGGGYIILITDKVISGSFGIEIKRK